MTRGAGTAMKTVEDKSSRALTDLINCDGFEGVHLDYQRQDEVQERVTKNPPQDIAVSFHSKVCCMGPLQMLHYCK